MLTRTSVIALTGLFAAAAWAQDAKPAPPDLDAAIARCRDFVHEEQWASGEAAYRKLFADFPEDPRLRARLREVEDGLKVCLFRKSLPPLKGQQIFGDAVKSFIPSTRDIRLSFPRAEGKLWTKHEDGLRVLEVRLESGFTAEFEMTLMNSGNRLSAIFACWDVEKRGGYLVNPGLSHTVGNMIYSAPPGVKRLARGAAAPLTNRVSAAYPASGASGTVKVTRTLSEIAVAVNGTTVAKATDSTYTSGYLGVLADDCRSIAIKGRVDRHAWRKLVAEHYARKFGEWQEKSYARDAEIPAWAREAPLLPPDMTLAELPPDAPDAERSAISRAVELAATGEIEDVLLVALRANAIGGATGDYVAGVAKLSIGATRAAADRLDRVVLAAPDLVAARLFRAAARFRLRRLDEARSDLAWVLERRPRCGYAVELAAAIAIFDQDLARARAVLAKAEEAGGCGEELDDVRGWVHRASRGPNFAQRFQHETANFVVASDHSLKVCYDAATLLESMQSKYAAAIGTARGAPTKSRVYVFSGLDGYMDYAGDLGVAADSTAGVYLTMLRELAIWIPVDMTQFTDTVRHEGFHQYLHRLLDDAPPWFNEGYAEVMGGGGPEGIRDAKRDGEIVAKFMPVRELVALKQRQFMAVAEVAYTQSRYLVDFLRTTKHPKLAKLLEEYLAALSEGLSHEDANAKVLAPVMDVLEAQFKHSL